MISNKLTCSVIALFCVLSLSACENTDAVKTESENVSLSTSVQNTQAITAGSQNSVIDGNSQEENSISEAASPVSDIVSYSNDPTSSDDTIIIEDQVFSAMVQDIYANADNYMGKTIQLTGMFDKYHDDSSGKTYYSVYRYDEMGCCTYGIEVDWDDSTGIQIQSQDQVVTVKGVLDKYTENSKDYLILHLSELTKSDK